MSGEGVAVTLGKEAGGRPVAAYCAISWRRSGALPEADGGVREAEGDLAVGSRRRR